MRTVTCLCGMGLCQRGSTIRGAEGGVEDQGGDQAPGSYMDFKHKYQQGRFIKQTLNILTFTKYRK